MPVARIIENLLFSTLKFKPQFFMAWKKSRGETHLPNGTRQRAATIGLRRCAGGVRS